MGLVIHGMSTALSTTITAILCYLFYGYFYIKLTDAQTHFLSGVEEVTTVYLLPRHARDSDTMLQEVAGLVHALREAADNLRSTQHEYIEAGTRLNTVAARLDERMRNTTENIDDIKQLLREGFRLPAAGD
jgi:septal ring factor EnvC (AmiA/AmiB activator)